MLLFFNYLTRIFIFKIKYKGPTYCSKHYEILRHVVPIVIWIIVTDDICAVGNTISEN